MTLRPGTLVVSDDDARPRGAGFNLHVVIGKGPKDRNGKAQWLIETLASFATTYVVRTVPEAKLSPISAFGMRAERVTTHCQCNGIDRHTIQLTKDFRLPVTDARMWGKLVGASVDQMLTGQVKDAAQAKLIRKRMLAEFAALERRSRRAA